MADCAAIKTMLDTAKAAYDRLTDGTAVRVVVDTDGSRIEYTAANADRLFAKIARLQVQYDACVGAPFAAPTRPVRFIF